MLPMIDHINRFVSDIEKFIVFYQDVLGYKLIDKGVKANGKKYAIMKGYNHELFISEKDDFHEVEDHFRHIGYRIENIEDLLKELKAKGLVEKDKNIIVKEFSKQFYIKDPDGFEIDLIQWTDKNGFYKKLNLNL